MTIGERLKSETAALHQQAERRPFQRALIKGDLPLAGYGAYLAQMLHVHRALEEGLASLGDVAPIREVVYREQFRVPSILTDLRAIGQGEGEPLVGTRAVVEKICAITADADAPRLLGMQYVLEGSTNGGRFIARALMVAYGLAPGGGLSYLDPYGEQQQQRWGEFCGALNAAVVDEPTGDALLSGARAMFLGVIGVLDSLGKAWSVKPEVLVVSSASEGAAATWSSGAG